MSDVVSPRLSLVAAGIALLVASAPAAATTTHVLRVVPRAQLSNARPSRRGHPLAAHHVFGTIVGINGNTLALKLRSGRMISIDATTAIANNDYSYPLFNGKTVAIDGAYASPAVFTATHVFAITTLQSLETDSGT